MSGEEPAENTGSVSRRWFPLESNPALLNKYISKLGFDTSQYSFVDVYSTDDWALEMVPPKTAAVVMLYPITPAQEAHRKEEDGELQRQSVSDKVWYTKQRIGNACGTIGILHSLANLPKDLRESAIVAGSWIDSFLRVCPASLTPAEKADFLEGGGATSDDDNRSKSIAKELENMHDSATSDDSNQTSRGRIDDSVITHFVAFVHVDGGLYELDGRKSAPVRHGNVNENGLLKGACEIVKQFMRRDPAELRFTILALAPTVQS